MVITSDQFLTHLIMYFSYLRYLASDDKKSVNDELENTMREAFVACYNTLPGIIVERLKKTTKTSTGLRQSSTKR
jgi:hypothetical protein